MTEAGTLRSDILKNSVIALTGGVATGKSTVARYLQSCGLTVIDADQLARQILEPDTPGFVAVVNLLGPKIIGEGGKLDRRAIREVIFADSKMRIKLENITHPLIRQALVAEVQKYAQSGKLSTIFYEASLIFETGTQEHFKEVWVTCCSQDTQINRLKSRSQISETMALAIVAAQMPMAQKIKLANVVIDTEKDMPILIGEVDDLLKRKQIECPQNRVLLSQIQS